MRTTSSLGLMAAMLMTSLCLGIGGCSSTQMPADDGGALGGGNGGGGHTGAGGVSGTDAGETCQSLSADYAAAFEAARTCSPFLTNVQCDHLASASLQCPNCPVHVNDTTRVDQIRAAFQARTDCPSAPCPAILCVNPGTSGACVANDSGSAGSCIDVH